MLKVLTREDMDYPFEAGAFGQFFEVRPGINWLRMPMPFALDHINLWTVEGAGGWAQFDTGFPTEEVRELWQDIFNNKLKKKPVECLYITHFHPDHIGLADWLCRHWDITLTATETEWLTARTLVTDGSDALTACYEDFYFKAGCDADFIQFMKGRKGIYKNRVGDIPRTFHRIRDGDRVEAGGREWEVVVGYGHSPEHACFYNREDRVFIAGDLVLPKITPNISVWANEPDANPLKEYMDSLVSFKTRVSDDALVLPSHGLPFYGLYYRIDSILRHHDGRLTATLEICREPKTALEVTRALIRMALDHHTMFFAIGEGLAHLNYLITEGKLICEDGPDGVNRYRTL